MTPDETEAEVKKLVKEIKNGMHSDEAEHWIFAPEAGTAVKRVIFVFGVPASMNFYEGKCKIGMCPRAREHLNAVSRDGNGTVLVVLNPIVIFPHKVKDITRGNDWWFTRLSSVVTEDEASLISCVEAINLSVDKIMKELKIQPENTYFFGNGNRIGGLAAASALSRPEKFGGVILVDSPLVNRRKVANGDVFTNKETPVHLILTRDCSKGLTAITEVVLKAKGVTVTRSFTDSFEFGALSEALNELMFVPE
ncbi:MAG: hypothetical protein KVP17_001949 [Porospora cf. gigantea B]|uniref:uncharacterized protein n=1 Tax=Porospora cf. gigantea B TaxID=2853592 RepID=UPI0035717CE2|nr:MAG: hypothetical protein KVP17_001949 [Porospora cf. gigantea B]